MNRKTRRKQKKDRVTQWIVNDLTNYLRASESLIAGMTDDEISEIVSFVSFFENMGQASNSKEEYNNVMLYVVSCETYNEVGNSYTYCKPDDVDCHVCKFAVYIDGYYAKVFARLPISNLVKKTIMGHHLILLSAAAMKREFKSLLAYARFIKLTLFEKDGVYNFVSEIKQSQAKRWVNTQDNFLMKWDISIQMPLPELIHVLEFDVPQS